MEMDEVSVRMTNRSPQKPRGNNMGRKKNPKIDWGEAGKDLAGASVGALVSTRVHTMVDDQLRKMDIQAQTRGFLKVLAAGAGIVGVSYLKQLGDFKDLPLEAFGYTAVGTTLKDGFDDIQGSTGDESSGDETASGMGRKRRRRKVRRRRRRGRRTKRGTFLEEDRTAKGTLATRRSMSGDYAGGMDPYDMEFMAMSNQYHALARR